MQDKDMIASVIVNGEGERKLIETARVKTQTNRQ